MRPRRGPASHTASSSLTKKARPEKARRSSLQYSRKLLIYFHWLFCFNRLVLKLPYNQQVRMAKALSYMSHQCGHEFKSHSWQTSFIIYKNFLFNWRDTFECWSLISKPTRYVFYSYVSNKRVYLINEYEGKIHRFWEGNMTFCQIFTISFPF